MKFHPYAEVFPLIEGADFDALAENIEAHGLREKIVIFDGKILDGRNRFFACKKAKVKPLYRTFKGTDDEALEYVISANIHRRHLTESQRASAAAKIANMPYGGDRRSDQAANLPLVTQAEAAKALNVSERSVRSAKKVHEKGSKELNEALDSGTVSVSKAASVVELPKREQLKAATAPKAPEAIEENWEPEDDEDKRLAAIEREQEASLQKWLDADDKLAAAHAEIKRLAAEVAVLKISRNGYQNQCGEQSRIIKALRNKLTKLEKSAA